MYRIRTTQTTSGATAVQVVTYEARKVSVKKHIGSAHTPEELTALKEAAVTWIAATNGQSSLFPETSAGCSPLATLDRCHFVGVRYAFAYDVLRRILAHFQFTRFGSPILTDLALIRIVEPASKLRSVELLERYFGVRHPPRAVYRALPEFVLLKEKVEACATRIAQKELNFDFSFVFYDVTTLYFESFEPDQLRKNGFSKDNKAQQPQILIGLVVNREGFPIAYDVFPGNTFEGHTFLPVLRRLMKKHKVRTITVVADAAMLSFANMEALKREGFRYIVGARLANCSPRIILDMGERLDKEDGRTIRLSTLRGDLICAFSAKRAAKDLREIEKQVTRAQTLVAHPGKIRRTKFLKTEDGSVALNEELVRKARILAGIKGYYTNLPRSVDDAAIINHYSDLWHVEHAFRIAKNDLEARPIFHHKEDAIKGHILICFIALVASKYMELRSGRSIRTIVDHLWSVVDARIVDPVTKREGTLRSEISADIRALIDKLFLSH